MEAVGWSSMLVTSHQTAWCHIPEENSLQSHCSKNFKSYIALIVICRSTGQCNLIFVKCSANNAVAVVIVSFAHIHI
jgi:hypothetical protein